MHNDRLDDAEAEVVQVVDYSEVEARIIGDYIDDEYDNEEADEDDDLLGTEYIEGPVTEVVPTTDGQVGTFAYRTYYPYSTPPPESSDDVRIEPIPIRDDMPIPVDWAAYQSQLSGVFASVYGGSRGVAGSQGDESVPPIAGSPPDPLTLVEEAERQRQMAQAQRIQRMSERLTRRPHGRIRPNAAVIIPTPMQDRSHNRQAMWERMQVGEHFPYATDVLHSLDIYPEDIPKQAFGIEMEVHTSKAMVEYQEQVQAWDKAVNAWYETKDFRKLTHCQELSVHYTHNEAIMHRDRPGNGRVNFTQCPACSVRHQPDGRSLIITDRNGISDVYDRLTLQVSDIMKDAPQQPQPPESLHRARRNFVTSLTHKLPMYSFIAKRDGSLDEECGVEVVSRPLALGPAREWLQSLANLCIDEGACVPSTSYGMHVHVNRRAFLGNAHIMRFFHAMNAYAANAGLVAFIGKDRAEANAHGDRRRGRDDPWARTYKQGYKRVFATGVWGGDHHDAVSLSPPNTVEVRVFQATTDSTIACANLEFVVALIEYLRPGSDGGSVIRFTFNNFFRWCLELRKKDYTFLYERLSQLIGQGDLIDPRLSVKEQRVQRRKAKAKRKCA